MQQGRAIGIPVSAAAGAIAGATAFLVTPLGPVLAAFGAIIGGVAGAAVGAAANQTLPVETFTDDDDAHYRALWDESSTRRADASYVDARPAYVFGHLLARHDEYIGRDFKSIEPAVRSVWAKDLAGQHGPWDSARPFVHDAYCHARSLGYGTRRDASRIGSAGSAVDPIELERARRGESSVELTDVSDSELPAYGEISIVEAQRNTRELF